MNNIEPENLAFLIDSMRVQLESDKIRLGDFEHELIQRMEADGATVLSHPEYEVNIDYKITYDKSKLHGLREFVSDKDLAASGYTEQHEETVLVNESWNMTKIKKLSKLGQDVRDAIEGAKITGAPQLRIKRKP